MQSEHDSSPQPAGFIFVRHIRACGMCTAGAKRFFIDHGMTSAEVQDFYQNGMSISLFEDLFGHDALAQQVIERAKQDGK